MPTLIEDFFELYKVGKFREPNTFVQSYQVRVSQIEAIAKNHLPQPLADDKTLLLVIDPQYSFCNPRGSLFVEGAIQDNQRLRQFILNNLTKVSQIVVSLDTHSIYQVFHAAAWKDSNGNNPKPFDLITFEDVKNKKWSWYKGNIDPDDGLKVRRYLEFVEAAPIWPYHCMKGDVSSNIVSALHEAFLLQSFVHNKDLIIFNKGEYPFADVLSPFSQRGPQEGITEESQFNTFSQYKKIIVGGQAKSHCVLRALWDISERFKYQSEILKRIYVAEDTMSCVGDLPEVKFSEITAKAFEKLAALGMNIVKSTEIKL